MIPATAQEAFNEVVRTRSIPWRPDDDPEARELSWMQLVRENRVPDTHCGLIAGLEAIIAADEPDDLLRVYAKRYNLEFPACTP